MRLVALVFILALFGLSAPAARAADPYEINVVVSLTGSRAFIGSGQVQALKALEAYVNKTGGINGRLLSFVVVDDQSNTQVDVQLTQGLIAKHVPIIMGPSNPGPCAAMMPLVAQDGPLLYCLANQGHPPPGGYAFMTLFSAEDQMAVPIRYFRDRGWTRIGYVVSTEADGQDAERALLGAIEQPGNKGLQIVAREYFAPSDISVTAQMARIKAARADAIVAWAAGSSAGTLLRGEQEAGLDVPTLTSPGNLNAAFFKQFASVLPKNLYFAGAPLYAVNAVSDAATKAALARMTEALAAVGAKPDQIAVSAWDPGLLLVEALRKLGPDASATKLRNYIINLKGWVGANGSYDFRAIPQRGIGQSNIMVVKWNAAQNAFDGVSKFGGAPIPGR